jgi:hypothetical protein
MDRNIFLFARKIQSGLPLRATVITTKLFFKTEAAKLQRLKL